ncbi:MAG: PH domain-containing protein [Bacilli bacterium]|jgi:membrane protein YdbS with pleckstrin-like domain|nr:PH domain-containing protein [Bacilli bacterium]MDD4345190.1 PH domain-containing protein [Bacilli bacterium]MDD4521259.1 PH domain-containing protein [Bacilli bacterium]MDY0399891.1 PH domain-containing protein [Bacilli bacterium]
MEQTKLRNFVSDNEQILWEGKPNKKCFILESIFNPLLPFAVVWLIIDLSFMGIAAGSGFDGFPQFVWFFFLIHLMPVWLYLFGVLFTSLRLKRIEYVITDRGVYISHGLFSYSYDMKPFTLLSTISIYRGIFDQRLKVGDVVFAAAINEQISTTRRNYSNNKFSIRNIPDFEAVYKLVKNLQTDIHADTMYPNALRPDKNEGYKTKYNGHEE